MGTHMFKQQGVATKPMGEATMQSRSVGAIAGSATRGAGAAQRDLGSVAAFQKHLNGPTKNTSATNAKGPKT